MLKLPLPARTRDLPETWEKLDWNSSDGRSLNEIILPVARVVFGVMIVAGCVGAIAAGQPAGLLLVVAGPGLLLAMAVYLPRMGCELSQHGVRIQTIPTATIPWANTEVSFKKTFGDVEALCIRDITKSKPVVVPNATRQFGARDVRACRLDQAAEQLAVLAADARGPADR